MKSATPRLPVDIVDPGADTLLLLISGLSARLLTRKVKQVAEALDLIPLRDRSKTNLPSKRQAEGFITHVDLQLVRKKLPVGSKERLLLSFYGGCIPPVRNDLHCAFIHMLYLYVRVSLQKALAQAFGCTA